MHSAFGLEQTSRSSSNAGGKAGWAPADLRIANQWSIYKALFEEQRATVPELAVALQVTKPTVSAGLGGLEQAGLIAKVGTRTGGAGRAPQLYASEPTAAWIVAVEIGRQWLRVALADLRGTIVRRIDIPTTAADHSPSVTQLTDEIERMLGAHNIVPGDNLISAVVASPGVYIPEAKRFFHNFALPTLSTEAFIEGLRSRLDVPVHVENDANMAALGELALWQGGAPTFVYVHVGVGVGLGIVIDGNLYRGAHRAAGEPLFMRFSSAPYGPSPLGSSKSDDDDLVSFARQQGDVQVRSAAEVLARALNHEERAEHALESEIGYLTEMLIPIISILDPEAIIFGGPVGEQLGPILPELEERVTRSIPLASPRLDVSKLGQEAIISGVVTNALHDARRAVFERRLQLDQ